VVVSHQRLKPLGEIPDSGLYLDGWQDNQLSLRDTYSDTQLEPNIRPDQSTFNDPIRPEWTVQKGSVVAQNEQLKLQGDGGNEDIVSENQRVPDGSNVNSVMWEYEYRQLSTGRDRKDNFTFAPWDQNPSRWVLTMESQTTARQT
jgi:hypothetical protein